MLKKKAFNRIFLTTIVFFLVFSLYTLKDVNYTFQNNEFSKKDDLTNIYTLNDDNYISKTAVYVDKSLSLEDKIKEKLEIMVKENNKNALLPSYFNPILPENTEILKVIVEDSLVKVYFSKELLNITEEQSEQMLEAIIYTITDENILGIEIYAGDSMLKYIPHTSKALPTVLTRDFGINKTYEISSTNDITKVVMTYYGTSNNEYYEIPITKYVNDDREKIEIIMEELENLSFDFNLTTLIENLDLLEYNISDDKISIKLNKDLTKEEETILLTSIFNNYDVEKIELSIENTKNDKKILEKTKKDIEN